MRNKGFFTTLLVSNCFILITSLVIALVGYFGYRNILIRYTNDYNMVILNQIRDIMDERIDSINNLIFNVSMNPSIENLRITEKPWDSYSRYNSVQAMNALDSYLAVYQYVDSIYIYFQKTDMIITNSSVYSSTSDFLKYSDHAYWEKEQWKRLFENKENISYSSIQNMTSGVMEKSLFTITYSLYSRNSASNKIFIVLNLDYSFLEDFRNDSRFFPDSMLLVRDSSGETLFSLGECSYLTEGYFNNTNALKKSDILNIDGTRLIVTSLSAALNNWEYYFILPENLFAKQATDIFIKTAFLLCFLVGLFMAVYFAKFNFIPIRNVIQKIQNLKGDSIISFNANNEIDFISQAVTKSFEEYKQIKGQLTRQIPVVQMHAVSNIVNGNFNNTEKIIKYCESIEITFPYPYFYVAIFNFDAHGIQAENLSLITAQFQYDIQVSKSDDLYIYTSDINENHSILALINTNVDLYVLRNTFENFINRIKRNINSAVNVTISLGSRVVNLKEVQKSYLCADRALQNQLMKLRGGIVYSNDMEVNKDAYYYPTEMETKLMNNVKSGNLNDVYAIIDLIIIENFIKNELSLEASRCLMFNMMGTAVRTINNIGIDKDSVFDKSKLYNDVLSCNNIQEMEATIRRIYYKICMYMNEERKNRAKDIIDQIIGYIHKKYSDNTLSLVSVSAEIGLNPTYLSGYFKEKTGVNFLPYVNNVRLEKAQELLRNTEKNINEIAIDVGYTNSGVLIRNFKKCYGITPGQYREQL